MCRIWDDEMIPGSWNFMTVVQIYKGKGLKELLENNRFIHTKPWMPKLFESIVVEKTKAKIVEKLSKFHIGGTVGHRP